MSKLKGKCFSACNKGQRNKSDLYCTPKSMTRQLFENEYVSGSVLEPCCGKNDIVDEIIYNKSQFITKSIDITSYDISGGTNFFDEKRFFDNIITNPPFSLANEFIKHAKRIYNKKIIMLLPLNYLHGKKRYDEKIFENLAHVYVFTRYPLLTDKTRPDGKYKTGMIVYAWFVWYKGYDGRPDICWIDNDKYILSKKDKVCQN